MVPVRCASSSSSSLSSLPLPLSLSLSLSVSLSPSIYISPLQSLVLTLIPSILQYFFQTMIQLLHCTKVSLFQFFAWFRAIKQAPFAIIIKLPVHLSFGLIVYLILQSHFSCYSPRDTYCSRVVAMVKRSPKVLITCCSNVTLFFTSRFSLLDKATLTKKS